MPKAKSSAPSAFNPLRLVSPAMLLFCLVLFFLPWVELQCVIPQDKMKDAPKEEVEAMKKELGIDPTKPVSMATQSGFQIATGGSSPGSDMKRIEAKMKEDAKKMGGTVEVESPKGKTKDKDDLNGAPLLFLYPILVLAGIAVPFLPIPGMIRSIAGAGCCGAALALILLQAAVGFPIEDTIKKQTEAAKTMGGGFGMGGGMGAPPGDKAGAKDAKSTAKEPEIFRVSWKFSLYVTFLLLLAGAGTAFLDILVGGAGKGKPGRKMRRDEDDYDEEDDRPRKKSRRDERDEDDEDDRPKKKRRDDEDEDDRSRKKPRRDDEEDDRPRKKKPLEPEFEMPAASASPPAAPAPAAGGANPFDFDSQEQPRTSRPRDDEDDRPRKKPRRDEDDYDDRPRKKRRDEDDYEEDDRPRKNRRDDEDDYDDRPRKKKPLEPEFEMPGAAPPPPAPPPAAPAGPNPFAFDDDEPAPKKKPRRRDDDDDDDYDDRPRKKRRRDDD